MCSNIINSNTMYAVIMLIGMDHVQVNYNLQLKVNCGTK